MNVCLFTDSFLPKIGGMELAVHYLAEALCAKGCRVTVMAKYVKGEMPLAYRYQLKRYGNRVPLSGRSGLDALAGIATLLRAHNRDPFDLVNCHGASYASSRVCLAKKMGLLKRPVIITPHGEDIQIVPDVGYGLRLKPRWDRIIRRNLQAADKVTAISTSISNQLEFLPAEKISRIPNGIQRSEFAARKNDVLHRLLDLPPERKIVLSVGRHRQVKGYAYGVRAFEHLQNKWPDVPLSYVLIGQNTPLLNPLIRDLNLNGKVFTVPQMPRADVVRAYASAWCFLSPSLSEGLSLVSIEAIACGLPLIVTDVPGNLDIVKDTACGMIVKAKDPLQIARALIHLWAHPREYDMYRKNALARAPEYDWGSIAEKYVQVYRKALTPQWTPAERVPAAN